MGLKMDNSAKYTRFKTIFTSNKNHTPESTTEEDIRKYFEKRTGRISRLSKKDKVFIIEYDNELLISMLINLWAEYFPSKVLFYLQQTKTRSSKNQRNL